LLNGSGEEAPAMSNNHHALVGRLSRKSVQKHFEAYRDVDWNDPEHAIDPTDPRWEKPADDPLGGTSWYQSRPQALRARIGLHHVVCQMKTGIAFEAVLGRGLFEFAAARPNRSPEFRYAYHELAEEVEHSLMFQEFVDRSGFDPRGLTGLDAFGARFVPRLGRVFPELFFVFVLGGEAPIDWVQRRSLRQKDLHPLLARIMRIHVTEEARHLAFAESFLRDRVPELGALRRLELRLRAPIALAASARSMLMPPAELIDAYAIPGEVLREAYVENPAHHARVIQSLESVRALCLELGILTPRLLPLWRLCGIAPRPEPLRRLPAAPSRQVPGIVRTLPAEWLQPIDSES
jgi:hypothetical protein